MTRWAICGTTPYNYGGWYGILRLWKELAYRYRARNYENQPINNRDDGQLITHSHPELYIASRRRAL